MKKGFRLLLLIEMLVLAVCVYMDYGIISGLRAMNYSGSYLGIFIMYCIIPNVSTLAFAPVLYTIMEGKN